MSEEESMFISTEKPDEPLIERPSTTVGQFTPSGSSAGFAFAVSDDTLDDIESIPWDNPNEAHESPYKRGKDILREMRKRKSQGKKVEWCNSVWAVRKQPHRKCKAANDFDDTTTTAGGITLPTTSETYQTHGDLTTRRHFFDYESLQTVSKAASNSSRSAVSLSLSKRSDSLRKNTSSKGKSKPSSRATLSKSTTQGSKGKYLRSKISSSWMSKSSVFKSKWKDASHRCARIAKRTREASDTAEITSLTSSAGIFRGCKRMRKTGK